MNTDKTLEDEIKEAMQAAAQSDAPENEQEDLGEEIAADDHAAPVADTAAPKDGAQEANPAPQEQAAPPAADDPAIQPPVALSGAIKAKWAELPADVRAEWKKREDDIHRMMTSHDGELRMGRSIKEIASPYLPIIHAEGGTIEGAFKDLLNTAYVLRAGTPQQKAQVFLDTAQQFGVDLAALAQQRQQPADPHVAQMQQQLQQMQQQFDPERIRTQLQEQMEADRIGNEIQAFAANPKHAHFQAVRTVMGSLMSSGQATDLEDAYNKACWANPSIREQLLTAQKEQEKVARKAEMDAKRKAAASVSGSPGMASPVANVPAKSLEDDLREQFAAAQGGGI